MALSQARGGDTGGRLHRRYITPWRHRCHLLVPGEVTLVVDERIERVAQAFHEAYERLAPSFGYETRLESAVSWEQVPEQNRALMRAVVAEVVGPLERELTELREAARRWLESPGS